MADTFGKRLDLARKRARLSQGELAKKAGLHTSGVGQHMRDAKTPQIDTVRKYAKALDVPLDWLADGVGSIDGRDSGKVPIGSAALDDVLDAYEWPSGIDVEVMDSVCEAVRAMARDAPRRPRSVWRAIIAKLIADGVPAIPVATDARR